MLNVPNFLTLLRILAIPLLLILLSEGRVGEALVVFVAAGITDALDGAIARLTNAKTTLGAYMDPLADKGLILSTFVVMASIGAVPMWLTVIVISRDVIILAGYLSLFLLTQEMMEIRPSRASKLTTFLHLTTLSVVLVSLRWPNWIEPMVLIGLFWLTAGATCASGAQYIHRGLSWYQSKLA